MLINVMPFVLKIEHRNNIYVQNWMCQQSKVQLDNREGHEMHC